MTNQDSITELINQAIKDIHYPGFPARLYAPISYTLEAGGKRLRPTLLLMAASALGLAPERAVNQAVGIEMFHNFTLLHDDVMDNADLRRGLPTVHRRWSANVAILSGDTMLTMAGQFMTQCDDRHLRSILELFNKTAIEVYEGQQLDMEFENRRDVTTDEYLNMIRLKTSVLIGCACRMGAILADADHGVCDAFYNYGLYLGLGFQLRDDVLDTYGDPILFGKQIGGDIINEKKTWLLTTAIAEDKDGELAGILTATLPPDEKINRVRAAYDRLELKQRCEVLIADYGRRALEALDAIDMPDDARRYFTTLTNKLTDRNS